MNDWMSTPMNRKETKITIPPPKPRPRNERRCPDCIDLNRAGRYTKAECADNVMEGYTAAVLVRDAYRLAKRRTFVETGLDNVEQLTGKKHLAAVQ